MTFKWDACLPCIKDNKQMASYLMAVILLFLLALLGCTKKNNLTGTNFSDIQPQYAENFDFEYGYTYDAEGKVSGKETVLLCGNHGGLEAVSFQKFSSLPRITDPALIDSAFFELTIVRSKPVYRYPLNLEFYKVNQSWEDSLTSQILDTNLELIPGMTYNTASAIADSVFKIDVPVNILLSTEADTLIELSFAQRTSDAAYLEIKSLETYSGARLKIYYRESVAEDAETKTYNSMASMDSYRIPQPSRTISDNSFLLRNIFPTRLYMKALIDTTLFTRDGEVLSRVERKRCTINSAELILHVKNNPYYDTAINLKAFPFYVKDREVTNPANITSANTFSLNLSQAFEGKVVDDKISIPLTSQVQAMLLNDDISNYGGVIIRSLQEMLNFGEIEFWHFDDPAIPDDKKPSIKIKYTIPYL